MMLAGSSPGNARACPGLQPPMEAMVDSKLFADMIDDGTGSLKQMDKYFYQVQGQMALAGVLWCDCDFHIQEPYR